MDVLDELETVVLPALTQVVVGEDERQHRFDDRAGAQGDAGVVPAFGDDFHVLSVAVGAAAGNEDAAGCLEGGAGDDGLAARYATQDAACVVRQEPGCSCAFVAVFAAFAGDDVEAVTDGYGLDGIDAHQRFGDVGVQAVEDGFAEAGGDAFGDDGDFCADAVARAADVGEIAVKQRGLVVVRAIKGVVLDMVPVAEFEAVFADLREVTADGGTGEVGKDLFGDGTAGDAYGGFPRRSPPAAAIVADAVFGLVGVVGVSGAVLVFDGAVVLATLVGVGNVNADGGAGGCAFKEPGKELDAVIFLARGDVARGAGFAPVEFALDGVKIKRDTRRSAIEDAADGRAVAFAVGGEGEVLSDAVAAPGVRGSVVVRNPCGCPAW